MNTSHLEALQVRLSHERSYLAQAKTEKQRAMRRVWIAQVEKEIAGERKFLGLGAEVVPELSDEELMAELLG